MLFRSSRPFLAQEAHACGLVSRVVPRDELDAAALELATAIAANSPASVSAIKRLINRGLEGDFGTGLRLESLNNRFGAANNEPNAEREQRLRAVRR